MYLQRFILIYMLISDSVMDFNYMTFSSVIYACAPLS